MEKEPVVNVVGRISFSNLVSAANSANQDRAHLSGISSTRPGSAVIRRLRDVLLAGHNREWTDLDPGTDSLNALLAARAKALEIIERELLND
jgi:hypothetical protein